MHGVAIGLYVKYFWLTTRFTAILLHGAKRPESSMTLYFDKVHHVAASVRRQTTSVWLSSSQNAACRAMSAICDCPVCLKVNAINIIHETNGGRKYQEVSHYFGMKSVKELICNRFEKFIMS